MKLIQFMGTLLCLSLAGATGVVGNWDLAFLFASIPVSYWIIYASLRAKRISDERYKAKMNEIEAQYAKLAKEREERRAREGLQTRSEAQQRYAAQQQQRQAFNNMHAQQLAAQQSAGMANARYGYGYSDPRAVHQQSALSDPFFNAVLANSLSDALTAGMGVTRTRTEETGEVKIEHVPVREVYRSADPEPERSSSSSSSYSSDTSSDSFSSSDTGSDSF